MSIVDDSDWREEERVTALSTQDTASLNASVSLDNSLDDMYSSPPGPLPCDADPRCCCGN